MQLSSAHHAAPALGTRAAPSFTLSQTSFIKDGQPFRIVSGSMHYFRTLPSQWHDRLSKAKQAGLNTIQFYVPWNLHEAQPGVYSFEGIADVVAYIKLAQQLGLLVILRPGPYACAEWEFGGFPYWLLRDHPDVGLRSSDPRFLAAVDRWFSVLLPKLALLLYSRGGNVVMVQVENEYGSYGSDRAYLEHIRTLYSKYLGEGVIYHSTDGNGANMLSGSYIGPSVFQTVDFGPNSGEPSANFALQNTFQGHGPAMNSEYYTGWITHWGDAHAANVSSSSVADYLDQILATSNASVNFYMFHGGSNFGFMSGANANDANDYQPVITSYDYNSPLTEAGDPTDKYFALTKVIAKYAPVPGPDPAPAPKGNYGTVTLTKQVSLFDSLESLATSIVNDPQPLTFEELSLDYGFVVYRATIQYGQTNWLTVQDAHDRAYVIVDNEYLGVATRKNPSMPNFNCSDGSTLLVLVENQGRINFGSYIRDRKGITEGVRIGGQFIFGWRMYALPLNNTDKIPFPSTSSAPAPSPFSSLPQGRFYYGEFTVGANTMSDTFLDTRGWGKGSIWINNFNLGRFWSAGPQLSLYVPWPVLRPGTNTLVILELEGTANSTISFTTAPIWA